MILLLWRVQHIYLYFSQTMSNDAARNSFELSAQSILLLSVCTITVTTTDTALQCLLPNSTQLFSMASKTKRNLIEENQSLSQQQKRQLCSVYSRAVDKFAQLVTGRALVLLRDGEK